MHTILITGGAGFIGSHLTRLFVKKYPEYKIVNLDELTYAGNLENLKDIEKHPIKFCKGRYYRYASHKGIFKKYGFTGASLCSRKPCRPLDN